VKRQGGRQSLQGALTSTSDPNPTSIICHPQSCPQPRRPRNIPFGAQLQRNKRMLYPITVTGPDMVHF
jgi:hypothetical protein